MSLFVDLQDIRPDLNTTLSYCWTLISKIQHLHPNCMRFETACLWLVILNPHTDLLLILYIKHNRLLIKNEIKF